MYFKAILVLCAQVFLLKSAFTQCNCGGVGVSGYGLGAPALAAPAAAAVSSGLGCRAGLGYGAGLSYGADLGYGTGSGYSGLAIEAIPTSGGSLVVTSSSPVAPDSLSVSSQNVFEGALSVAGELPFLSAVALDGALASGGAGAVSHSVGNGIISIESLGSSAAGYAPASAYAPAAAISPAIGSYGAGLAGISPAPVIASGLNYGSVSSLGYGCGCGNY